MSDLLLVVRVLDQLSAGSGRFGQCRSHSRRAAEGANLNPTGKPRLTFHDLRHTFGSHLALSGIDPVAVQRQMGHARASITMDVYAHEFESARRREQVSEHLISALGGLISVEI